MASNPPDKPSRSDAENAVRTLIRWAGNDPTREGLLDTPARMVPIIGKADVAYLPGPGGEHLQACPTGRHLSQTSADPRDQAH